MAAVHDAIIRYLHTTQNPLKDEETVTLSAARPDPAGTRRQLGADQAQPEDTDARQQLYARRHNVSEGPGERQRKRHQRHVHLPDSAQQQRIQALVRHLQRQGRV